MAIMKAYHVVHWDTVHETAESRKLKRLPYVAKPNKHDGLGFRQVAASAERELLYAGWSLILEVASKAPPGLRGWLIRNGQPLDAQALAIMTGFAVETFDKCLKFFSSKEVNWLELLEYPPKPGGHPGPLAAPAATPGESAGMPGGHPGPLAHAAGIPGESPGLEYSTVPYSRVLGTEREKGTTTSQKTSLAEVQASRTQFGALRDQVKALEARQAELSNEERSDLRKKRALLSKLQKNQAAGNFAPSPNV